MRISFTSLTIGTGLLSCVFADYNEYGLGRRSSYAEDLDLFEDLYVRDVMDYDLDLEDLYVRDLAEQFHKLLQIRAPPSKTPSRKSSSSSSSRSHSPVEEVGGVTYVWMGGTANVAVGHNAMVAGLDSCIGLIAVGSRGAYVAHVAPGSETAGARAAAGRVSGLGTGVEVYIKVPDNMPSSDVTRISSALGRVSTHILHYRTGQSADGATMSLRWSGGRGSVS